jgi:hypothetical protein
VSEDPLFDKHMNTPMGTGYPVAKRRVLDEETNRKKYLYTVLLDDGEVGAAFASEMQPVNTRTRKKKDGTTNT